MPDTVTETAIAKNESFSVRQFAPGAYGGFVGDNFGFIWPSQRDLIPAWGTTDCDIMLRVLHYTQHNGLVGGAVELFIEKFLSIPHEISGGRNLTFQWQDLFAEAEFGEGYDVLMGKGLVDYCTLNRGMFLELVTYGDPSLPIQEGAKIIGVNHLDAMRIQFTGNREWPYLYMSEWYGGLRKLHYTHVIRVTRQSSPNTLMYGMGKSALYDALTVANSQILLGRHQNELLSDLPPPGIVIFNNVKPDEVQDAMKQFEYERRRDGQNMYRAPLSMSSLDPSQPATVTFVPMATVPEGFDYKQYMDIHVNYTALAFGLDPQDLWPLTGSSIGTDSQSKVLATKTDVKGPAYVANILTPTWNFRVLPRSMEWKYKAANPEQDRQTADTAQVWTAIGTSSNFMTKDEIRQLVANQVPAFADVLLDEQGQVRLFDDDVKEPEQVQVVVAQDDVQLDATNSNAQDVTAGDNTAVTDTQTPVATKSIDDTDAAFVDEIKAIMQDGIDRTITKAGCAARIRGAITRYGKAAYLDGLKDGCVESGELTDDDTRKIADIAVYDTQYVTNLVNEIYSEAGMSGTPDTRAPLWKSTSDQFYYAGIESADKNGMYSFEGDDGKENCNTCSKLKGQKHRMSWWVSKELRPGIDHDNFECGTWPDHCQHYLERVGGC